MPNQAIDLMRGCEAWYDLDPRYYNNQRGVLADKSGYGRHAEASGGPTVGVEGPDSFKAASFDGTDDYFDAGDPIAVSGSFTASILMEIDEVEANRTAGNMQNGGWKFDLDGNANMKFVLADGSGNKVSARMTNPLATNEWHRFVGVWTGEEVVLVQNGDVIDNTSVSSHTTSSSNVEIGSFADVSETFDGRIAEFSQHSRDLSWAEIQQLDRMTAPRRAML